MNKADRILKKKRFIKREMDRQIGRQLSDEVWNNAREKLDGYLKEYEDLPEGVRMHTDNYIFPSSAIYLSAKEKTDEATAYRIVENSAVWLTDRVGILLKGILSIPGFNALFLGAMKGMCQKMYGRDNGFENIYYPDEKGSFRMDVVSCPFCRYFTKLGCSELTKIFCENDDRVYGKLTGIEFRRTSTLGKGGDRCDFCFRRRRS